MNISKAENGVEARGARAGAGTGVSAGERVLYLLGASFFAGVVAVASVLTPSPTGIGTHTQLGLPPCGLYQRFGIPCLSCGMTTAFCHMVRFQFLRALDANPLGTVLFLTAAGLSLAGLYGAAFGWSLVKRLERLDWGLVGLVFLFLALGSWAYKIVTVACLG